MRRIQPLSPLLENSSNKLLLKNTAMAQLLKMVPQIYIRTHRRSSTPWSPAWKRSPHDITTPHSIKLHFAVLQVCDRISDPTKTKCLRLKSCVCRFHAVASIIHRLPFGIFGEFSWMCYYVCVCVLFQLHLSYNVVIHYRTICNAYIETKPNRATKHGPKAKNISKFLHLMLVNLA